MMPSTNSDDNRSNNGAPESTQPESAIVGSNQSPNDLEASSEAQLAPPAIPPSARRNDALWGGLATAAAVAAMLGSHINRMFGKK
jgi:hypothetical protein